MIINLRGKTADIIEEAVNNPSAESSAELDMLASEYNTLYENIMNYDIDEIMVESAMFMGEIDELVIAVESAIVQLQTRAVDLSMMEAAGEDVSDKMGILIEKSGPAIIDTIIAQLKKMMKAFSDFIKGFLAKFSDRAKQVEKYAERVGDEVLKQSGQAGHVQTQINDWDINRVSFSTLQKGIFAINKIFPEANMKSPEEYIKYYNSIRDKYPNESDILKFLSDEMKMDVGSSPTIASITDTCYKTMAGKGVTGFAKIKPSQMLSTLKNMGAIVKTTNNDLTILEKVLEKDIDALEKNINAVISKTDTSKDVNAATYVESCKQQQRFYAACIKYANAITTAKIKAINSMCNDYVRCLNALIGVEK